MWNFLHFGVIWALKIYGFEDIWISDIYIRDAQPVLLSSYEVNIVK
jgi:hypothetical protein